MNCLYRLVPEITVRSRQLDPEFKSALGNSELRDDLLVLLSIDIIAYSLHAAARVARSMSMSLVDRRHAMWNAIFDDVSAKLEKYNAPAFRRT